jgi:hypothetical protein
VLTEGFTLASVYAWPCSRHLRNAYNVQSSSVVALDEGRRQWHQRKLSFCNAAVHVASRRGFHDCNVPQENEIVISRLEQFAVLLAEERLGVRMMVIKRAPSRNIKFRVVNVSEP